MISAFTCHGLLVQIRLAFLETPVPQWLLLIYDLVLGERLRRMACRGSGVRVSLAPFKRSPASGWVFLCLELVPAVHSSQLSSQRAFLGSTRNVCHQSWLLQRAGESRETLAELGARRTNPYLGLDFVLSRVSTSKKGAFRLPKIPCDGKGLRMEPRRLELLNPCMPCV